MSPPSLPWNQLAQPQAYSVSTYCAPAPPTPAEEDEDGLPCPGGWGLSLGPGEGSPRLPGWTRGSGEEMTPVNRRQETQGPRPLRGDPERGACRAVGFGAWAVLPHGTAGSPADSAGMIGGKATVP